MKLTTEQKRIFIKAIATGKAKMKDFETIPGRHFKRISPVVQDEISLNNTSEPEVNILPDTLFQCQEDGKQYAYRQVKEMQGNAPFVNTFYSLAYNEPTEPAAISSIEIMQVEKECLINYFLNNNY